MLPPSRRKHSTLFQIYECAPLTPSRCKHGVAGEVAHGVGAAEAGLVLPYRDFDEAIVQAVFALGEVVVRGGAGGEADERAAAPDGDGLRDAAEELGGLGLHR